MAEDRTEAGFGLYVHWPFCAARCPYCDFNSHVAPRIDHDAWARAYVAEIARLGAELPGRVLDSIYFGGGTPSLMPPETVAEVIAAARRWWHAADDIEITLEANPGSAEAGRFAAYRDAGVNRLSLGVQALDDAALRLLGRIHGVAEARAALRMAQACFDRVSFDLIYARQHQSLADWRAELTEALAMASGHLSLYQLTIEAGTAFGQRHGAGKLRGLPTEDLAADMYALTQDLCGAAGLAAYEVSNHAAPGMESRHNLIYWRQGDYAGIGPGAHGRVTIGGQRFATETPPEPADWLRAVAQGSGESRRTALTGPEQAAEYLLMGLRLAEGIDLRRLAALAGRPLPAGRIAELESLGMVTRAGSRLRCTGRGRMLLNAVIGRLLGA